MGEAQQSATITTGHQHRDLEKQERSINSKQEHGTPMSMAALFITARTWKQAKCPSTDEWTKKMWCVCGCVGVCIYMLLCIYNGILLNHKKNEIMPFAAM